MTGIWDIGKTLLVDHLLLSQVGEELGNPLADGGSARNAP